MTHFTVASLKVFLHIWMDPMVFHEDQDHGIHVIE